MYSQSGAVAAGTVFFISLGGVAQFVQYSRKFAGPINEFSNIAKKVIIDNKISGKVLGVEDNGGGNKTLIIEIDNKETPILDGSADLFIKEIQKADIQELNEERKYLIVKKEVKIKTNFSSIKLIPYDGFKIDINIDFKYGGIGRQTYSFDGTQKTFLKEFGNITTFGSFATFVSAILGGILFAKIGANGVLWLEAAFALFALFAFLLLPELLEVRRVVKHKTAIVDAATITYKTLQNPKLRNLIIFPALFGSFTIVMLWIMQPIMETAHVPISLFGFYFGINQLSVVFFAKYAYKICEKLGEITVSVLTIGTLVFGITMGLLATHVQSMPIVYIACAFMAIAPGIRVLNNLQYNTLIHHSIRSVERGTVLSTRAMMSTLLGAVSLIAAKFLMDDFGITTTLVVAFIMIAVLIWSLKHVSKYIPSK